VTPRRAARAPAPEQGHVSSFAPPFALRLARGGAGSLPGLAAAFSLEMSASIGSRFRVGL
jgi:hypothetical protein